MYCISYSKSLLLKFSLLIKISKSMNLNNYLELVNIRFSIHLNLKISPLLCLLSLKILSIIDKNKDIFINVVEFSAVYGIIHVLLSELNLKSNIVCAYMFLQDTAEPFKLQNDLSMKITNHPGLFQCILS